MTRLARKVSPAKWRTADWASPERLPADAISADLRTTANTLSFWRADVEGHGDESAILALLGTMQRVEKIDIAFVDDTLIEGAASQSTLGDTLVENLRDLHVDLVDLDHSLLIKTAFVIGREIFASTTMRLTKAQVKGRLQKAVNDGHLSWDTLPSDMQSEITRPI